MTYLVIFRTLVVLLVIALAVGYWLPFGQIGNMDGARLMFSLSGSAAHVEVSPEIQELLALVQIFVALGLLSFFDISRHLFVLVSIAGIAMLAVTGVRAVPPLHGVIFYIAAALQGAIIFAAYTSPIRDRFASNRIKGRGVTP